MRQTGCGRRGGGGEGGYRPGTAASLRVKVKKPRGGLVHGAICSEVHFVLSDAWRPLPPAPPPPRLGLG